MEEYKVKDVKHGRFINYIKDWSYQEWVDYQNSNSCWVCHKCGRVYYNIQKFSSHLKRKCNTSYKMWYTKYYHNNIIPRCKICGKYSAWLPNHKSYGATCNSSECFSENSRITALNTVKIYGDQRNPQNWTFDQIRANGYSNRSDPKYIDLLNRFHESRVKSGTITSQTRHSGGLWGWHSKAENKLMETLKIIYPDLEREIYPEKCNGRFRMDGWIPSMNMYIEEDGEFKRDKNNPLYTPNHMKYIIEKKTLVHKITGAIVKNIWESDVWKFIKNINELKEFIESDIDQSDKWKFND